MKINIPKLKGAKYVVTNQGLVAEFSNRNELVIANRQLLDQLDAEGLQITETGEVVEKMKNNNEQPETITETNTVDEGDIADESGVVPDASIRRTKRR